MSVREIVANYNNSDNFDYMVGWIIGLNLINQFKIYVSKNAMFYEREAKKGKNNCGHMKASLMLYYISQEDNFNDWYREHNTENTYVGH
jgi:hypothetical protein